MSNEIYRETVDQLITIANNDTIVELPIQENVEALAARLRIAGNVNQISAETYFCFLELLPPVYASQEAFVFAERYGSMRLFWERDGKFFCRQLPPRERDLITKLAMGSS